MNDLRIFVMNNLLCKGNMCEAEALFVQAMLEHLTLETKLATQKLAEEWAKNESTNQTGREDQ